MVFVQTSFYITYKNIVNKTKNTKTNKNNAITFYRVNIF